MTDKMLEEAARGLDRLDRLSQRVRDAGGNDTGALMRVHSLMLGYLAGGVDDDAWDDAERAALKYAGLT